MAKRKGKHLDTDGFDAATDGILTRVREFRDAAHRARSDADFAEMAERDFRKVLDGLIAAVGSVIEMKDREGVLRIADLECALATANQLHARFCLRSDAHYAERQAELDRQQEAQRAAETALMDEPVEETPEPETGAGEAETGAEEPSPYIMPLLGADDEPSCCDPEKFPAFLRRNAA